LSSLTSCSPLFFFNTPATTKLYTLSLHDALPIYMYWKILVNPNRNRLHESEVLPHDLIAPVLRKFCPPAWRETGRQHCLSSSFRSEEHTSELQSLTNLVCRLLLEKKQKNSPHDV